MPIKLVVTAGLFAATAWAYVAHQSWQMAQLGMAGMWMPPVGFSAWPFTAMLWIFSMWAIMMAAMMLPSAIPMLLAFSRYCHRDPTSDGWRTVWFALGYLLVWIVFSIGLTALQWLFQGLAWLSPMMENRQPLFAAAVLAMAGIYQFTPIKNACLQHCRTPFGFLLNEWRPGKFGALSTGFKHGLECLGCCWAQMLIMFVVGVMNLTGMVFITLLVILEKWAPVNNRILSYSSGIFFLIWSGYWLLLSGQ